MDTHEFSSAAYITLTQRGVIIGMNLTAAALFGTERKKLLLRNFLSLVAPEDSDCWISYFMDILQRRAIRNCKLALKHNGGHIFHARLDHLNVGTGNQFPVRIALTDITGRKRYPEGADIAPAAFEIHDGIMCSPSQQAATISVQQCEATSVIAAPLERSAASTQEALRASRKPGNLSDLDSRIIRDTATYQQRSSIRRRSQPTRKSGDLSNQNSETICGNPIYQQRSSIRRRSRTTRKSGDLPNQDSEIIRDAPVYQQRSSIRRRSRPRR